MTLKEFIQKWEGEHVDFDGIYPNQCMDLMHQYVYEVLDIKDKSVLSAPAAYQVYTDFRWESLFEKIPNTPEAVPQEGDLIVWGTGVGEWGHIAIYVDGDVMSFNSFDANWPVGSLPHIQHHVYDNVLGWLRFKEDKIPLKDRQIDWYDFEGNQHEVGWYVREWKIEKENAKKLAEEIAEKSKFIEQQSKSISELNQTNTSLKDDLTQVRERRDKLEDKVEILEKGKKRREGAIESLEEELKKNRAKYNELEKKYTKLSDKMNKMIENMSILEFIWRKVFK